ncbi:MAG: flagellar protein FliT [Roseburia sp.]|nr:flagellar protein FliT [Roseburia sp.]
MTESYIQIMAESLEKKLEVLDDIMEINKRQLECSNTYPFDVEAYDKIVDEKSELVDEINRLDDGFTSTYELVREEVQANPEQYRDGVLRLQELVREAIEKGVSVEAQEKRNKASMETALGMRRQEIKKSRISTDAAMKYYNAVSKINNVDPQLMDKKK